ncbi:Por secretion system C-terminal sorting domain-containing protein [Psychroflexus sediminis]|uniref:Por secretion system C-terminal sorting domain-containing protein n=2 Tax=Psychroflexus sediminis TaxID=470826 RepID=A0A1G7XS29_9FLAO|nr:Por secretion system C-terminal sorting domain-containing protein [Psychroflexus sediminis]
MKIRYSFIFSFLLFFYYAGAQVTNEGQPKSWQLTLNSVETISMPSFDLKTLQKEDIINDKKENQPYRFGYEHQVSLSFEDGKWNRLKNGDRVWLLNVRSKGAKTLNFLFDEFYIPEGAKLYFYNNDKTDLLGAYTASQNRDDMEFGTWLINGDNVWIEYFEPAQAEFNGQLHISKVVHGYRSVSDIPALKKALNDSGSCNQDVNCPVGSDFDTLKDQLKKAVAMIVVGSSGFCSGSLINNTNNDRSQYFLTANHCLTSSTSTWAFRFNWISQNPSCSTTSNSTDASFNQTVSGATLLANNSKSDFALLEIDAPLPDDWDLVWAGWDRSGVIPDFSVGIHHPRGDIMKVSRDDNSPVKNSRIFNGNDNMENWYLYNWELGVTEEGSSGSPLFDENGRIIGQLAGGAAACNGTENNGAFDFYGRFDVSWDFGDTPSSRLKEWLDPAATGRFTLNQYPPAQIFNDDIAIIVDNIDNQICGDEVTPVFSLQNRGNTQVTAATLTYQFGSQAPQTVEWTGSLTYLEREVIASPVFDLSTENRLTASIEIKDKTDDFPDNNTFTSTIDNYKNDTYTAETVTLTLKTDDYANETSWQFYDQNGTLIQESQGTLTDQTTYTEVFNLNPDSCYEFVILDSAGDGICCDFGTGSYKLETGNGEIISENGAFGSIEVSSFRTSENLSSDDSSFAELSVYPNPVSSSLTVETNSTDELNLSLFDIRGKQIYSVKMSENKTIDLEAISSGMYFLKINNGVKSITKKIIKL